MDDVIVWDDKTFCPDCFLQMVIKPEALPCVEDKSLIYQAFGADEIQAWMLIGESDGRDPDDVYEAFKEEQLERNDNRPY